MIRKLTYVKRVQKISPHDSVNASVVAMTVWKSTGITMQLNVAALIRLQNK